MVLLARDHAHSIRYTSSLEAIRKKYSSRLEPFLSDFSDKMPDIAIIPINNILRAFFAHDRVLDCTDITRMV